MKIDRVTVRLAQSVRAAAERKASQADLSLGEWIRKLVVEATGVHYEHKQGYAAMPKKARQAAQKAAVKSRLTRSFQGDEL